MRKLDLLAIEIAALTITAMSLSIALAIPPKSFTTPATGAVGTGNFVCPDFAPIPNYCTNSTHPYFLLRSNGAATNSFGNPGGSVGIRMRHAAP